MGNCRGESDNTNVGWEPPPVVAVGGTHDVVDAEDTHPEGVLGEVGEAVAKPNVMDLAKGRMQCPGSCVVMQPVK